MVDEKIAQDKILPVDTFGRLLFSRSEAIRWYKRLVGSDRTATEYKEVAKKIKQEYNL